MNGPVIFIGSYRIPEGAFETFASGIRDMSGFVEAEVPGVRLFHTYVNAARTEGRRSTCTRTAPRWRSTWVRRSSS